MYLREIIVNCLHRLPNVHIKYGHEIQCKAIVMKYLNKGNYDGVA